MNLTLMYVELLKISVWKFFLLLFWKITKKDFKRHSSILSTNLTLSSDVKQCFFFYLLRTPRSLCFCFFIHQRYTTGFSMANYLVFFYVLFWQVVATWVLRHGKIQNWYVSISFQYSRYSKHFVRNRGDLLSQNQVEVGRNTFLSPSPIPSVWYSWSSPTGDGTRWWQKS